MSPPVSQPVLAMLLGQVFIAFLLFWMLPISTAAAEAKSSNINLSLGNFAAIPL